MPATPSVVDEANARWVTEDVTVALRERDELIADLREQLASVDTRGSRVTDEALFEGVFYRWLCPRCEDVNEDENDIRGDDVECDSCGWVGTVSGE